MSFKSRPRGYPRPQKKATCCIALTRLRSCFGIKFFWSLCGITSASSCTMATNTCDDTGGNAGTFSRKAFIAARMLLIAFFTEPFDRPKTLPTAS